MAKVTYQVVEHDGGWAYRAKGTYSETFPTHDAAFRAARAAACEQMLPGESRGIVWEDAGGKWHAEVSRASDHPETTVEG